MTQSYDKNDLRKSRHSSVSRSEKGSTPLGTAIYSSIRLIEVYLQYGILAWGWGDALIRRLGGKPLPLESTPVYLGLPYWRLSLLLMALGGSVKAIFYLVFVSKMAMPPRAAISVGFFKVFSTTFNTLLFCTAATSAATAHLGQPASSQPLLATAWWLFAIGLYIETASELQRKAFKDRAENAGKPYTDGLFAYARHINYGGFSICKAGYALATCGWLWSILTLAWLIVEFRRRVIPDIDKYCEDRVGNLVPGRILEMLKSKSSMVQAGNHSRNRQDTK